MKSHIIASILSAAFLIGACSNPSFAQKKKTTHVKKLPSRTVKTIHARKPLPPAPPPPPLPPQP